MERKQNVRNNISRQSGFTLLELMMTLSIMGIVCTGLAGMMTNGFRGWNFGAAKIALNSESRTCLVALTKFIQNAQASSITVSRLNINQPAYSYISGKLAETIYLSTSSPGICGFSAGGAGMVGTAGSEFAIYQDGRKLMAKIPVVPPGADLSNPAAINITYNYITLSRNLNSLMMVFNDTTLEKSLSIGAVFSKFVYPKDPPVDIYLKKVVVIKHKETSGFYGN